MEGALSRVHVAASLECVLYKLCMEKELALGVYENVSRPPSGRGSGTTWPPTKHWPSFLPEHDTMEDFMAKESEPLIAGDCGGPRCRGDR